MLPLTIDAKPFEPFTPAKQAHPRNLTGQVFGRLTVFGMHCKSSQGGIMWLCRCRCGNWIITSSGHLTKQNKPTTSCGCLWAERQRQSVMTHGESVATPEYGVFASAKNRCVNSNAPNFRNYGGRGIEFRFTSYEQFIEHLGHRPSAKHSLDRYPDNDGHYEPGNVRWATAKEQARNTRTNRLITWQGRSVTLSEWSEILGVKRETLLNRITRGWSLDRAFTTPSRDYAMNKN